MAVRSRVYEQGSRPGLEGFFTPPGGRRVTSERADEARLNNQRPLGTARPSAPAATVDPLGLLDLLAGGGGPDLSSSIASSYDKQIGAYQNMGGEIAALTDQLVGNINSSASATNDQIGSYFGYAADQANAGRPVIEQSHTTAMGNVDAIYDQLASNLAGIPKAAVGRATEAAGGAIGGSVAGRVAAATAPFQAAGETSRANAKANLTTHSAAGQDYLSQLAAAAPSEAAQNQAAVSGRAANAVTEAQMALAQQRAQIAAQTAALEGAKERAILEHSADLAGGTFQRLMQTTQLYGALGADVSPLRDALGLQAAPQAGVSYEDQLDILTKEARLEDLLAEPSPYELGGDAGFEAALGGTTAATQKVAMALRDYAEQNALGFEDIQALLAPEGGDRMNPQMQALLEQLVGGQLAYDPEALKTAFRAWVQ